MQGLSRFMSGTYTTHYPDPKVNPRLLLESQCECSELCYRVLFGEQLAG